MGRRRPARGLGIWSCDVCDVRRLHECMAGLLGRIGQFAKLTNSVVNYQRIGQFYRVGQTDVKLVNSFRVFTITYKCIVFYTFKLWTII
jgi:hypothetical protein